MELVYLWVEDYKNIHKQGFNFSPRFECSYDGENLTIDKNEDYVSIFPKNINITAIVGENGSGKSNLLDLILDINGWATTQNKILYLTYKENKLYLYLVNFINKINSNYEIEQHIIDRKSTGIAKYSLTNMGLNCSYLSLSPFLNKVNNFYSNSSINFLSIYNYKKNYDNNTFNFNEFFFSLIPCIPELLEDKLINSFFRIQGKPEFLVFTISTYVQKLYQNEVKNIIDSSIKLKTTNNLLHYMADIKNESIMHSLYTLHNDIENRREILSKRISELDDAEKKRYLPNINNQKVFNDVNLVNGLNNNRITKEISDLTSQLNNINTIDLYFTDKNSSSEFYFSTGELVLLYYLKKIKELIKSKEESILLIDECELFLHPEWQKKFIIFLSELFKNKKSNNQIILASHSPFILSDLPKENVIFLKNGKQVDVDINPFGANIHTLLSHGFFMQDGLMGEFAKEKINNIINFHKKIEENEKNQNELEKVQKRFEYKKEYEDKKEHFKHIQSIIGEDYLKQVIKNHIVEIEKILYKNEYIDSEIEKVKEELKRLEAIKNA